MKQNKILYLSALQGFLIFLVVLGHCWYIKDSYIWHFCYGVHMPLFMFISGGLFFMTRLSRMYSWKDVLIDKSKRLLVPYVFFMAFAYLIKIVLSGNVKNTVEFSISNFLLGFFYPTESACKEMWFIAALFLMFTMYPIYFFVLKNKLVSVAFFTLSIFVSLCIESYIGGGFVNYQGLLRYLCYFFAGILFFKYSPYALIDNKFLGLLTCLIYIVTCPYRRIVPVPIAFAGIWGLVFLFRQVCLFCPNIFSSFRDFSFQIFLMGLYPQMFVELFLAKTVSSTMLLENIVLCIFSICLALYVPVIISLFSCKWLRFLNPVLGVKDKK